MPPSDQAPAAARLRRSQKVALALFGVVVALAALEIGLRLGGLAFRAAQDRRNERILGQDGTVRILCVGESTTALGGDDSYPSQLERVLNEMPDGPRVSVVNGGLTGAKSHDVVAQLETLIRRYRPDVVIAMLGVNDVGDQVQKPATAREKLRAWIESLRVYKLYALLADHLAARWSPRTGPRVQEARVRRAPAPTPASSEGGPFRRAVTIARKLAAQGKMDEAYAVVESVLAVEPTNVQALSVLAEASPLAARPETKRHFRRAEAILQKRLRRTSASQQDALDLVRLHLIEGRPDRAGDVLLAAGADLPIPSRDRVTVSRALWRESIRLENEGDVAGAKEKLEKALPIVAPDETRERARFLAQLARLEERSGDDAQAERLRREADELRAAGYVEATRTNYRELKRILDAHGIPLVAMQYPLRPLAPLREMLDDAPDVVFVSNQKVFEEALARQPYEALFWDSFAGDFGHATAAGNEVIARNAARALRASVLAAAERREAR